MIAYVPSAVVFQDVSAYNPDKSSWSYKGEPLPFVPFVSFDYSELYKLSLQNADTVKKVVIKVENIECPVLLLSGKEDTVWPSAKNVRISN